MFVMILTVQQDATDPVTTMSSTSTSTASLKSLSSSTSANNNTSQGLLRGQYLCMHLYDMYLHSL